MPTSTGHRGSSDHRLALRHQWRCRQAKASVHKTPSLVHRHHLSRSPGRNPLRSFSTKEGASSSPAQSVVATPHQDGGSHDRSQGLLAAARLLLRELSQELIPITSTKHSHKCAQAYMMYNEALRWLEVFFKCSML